MLQGIELDAIFLNLLSLQKNHIIMNKSDLVKHIAGVAGITQAQAELALSGFTGAVSESLKNNEPVTLIGFGTFGISERAARTGRNPQTGEALKISAKKLPKFTAGKALKEAVAIPAAKAKKK